MSVRTYLVLTFLLLPSLFGQNHTVCDLVKQDEADALLRGSSKQLAVTSMGCGYSNRANGLRLTITVMDLGNMANTTWDGMKSQAQKNNSLVGGEPGMGSNAYSQMIKRSAASSAGRCAFVAVKGTKVIQVVVTDEAEKDDLAGKKEMLDKLRPVAQKAVERL
jgi:hypothetical protein